MKNLCRLDRWQLEAFPSLDLEIGALMASVYDSAYDLNELDLPDLDSIEGDYNFLQTVDLPEQDCEHESEITPPQSVELYMLPRLLDNMRIYTIHETDEEHCLEKYSHITL
jgi:hypothetical protein